MADNGQAQTITRAGTQSTIPGSDTCFTGKVTIAPLFSAKHPDAPVGCAYVTFAPGARSFWHTHPAGQHLIVTDGVGRTGNNGWDSCRIQGWRRALVSGGHQTLARGVADHADDPSRPDRHLAGWQQCGMAGRGDRRTVQRREVAGRQKISALQVSDFLPS